MSSNDEYGVWTPFVLKGEDAGEAVYLNNRYQVFMRYMGSGLFGPMHHLSIKRVDQLPIHDWRDLQRIKNELVGPETEAVEIYPPESELVDTSNQFHLWVFGEYHLPFGYRGTRLVSENSILGAVQRPFEVKPPDLKTEEQMKWEVRKHQDRLAKKKR